MDELTDEEIGFIMDLLEKEYKTSDNSAKINEAKSLFDRFNSTKFRVFIADRTMLVCILGGKK